MLGISVDVSPSTAMHHKTPLLMDPVLAGTARTCSALTEDRALTRRAAQGLYPDPNPSTPITIVHAPI